MITPEYVRLMAAYTKWQNDSIYAAASTLDDNSRKADQGAYFASIHATLNHLLWGDEMWLHRLAEGPKPRALGITESTKLYSDWSELSTARAAVDRFLLHWADGLLPRALEGNISWFSAVQNMQIQRSRAVLTVQLFNHGTHHRGQVHAMLTAKGANPADTDVQFIPKDYYNWA